MAGRTPAPPNSRHDRCTAQDIRVACEVVRDAHVPHFGVHQAVQHPPVDHAAAAQPGANREIDKGVQPLCGAPSTERPQKLNTQQLSLSYWPPTNYGNCPFCGFDCKCIGLEMCF